MTSRCDPRYETSKDSVKTKNKRKVGSKEEDEEEQVYQERIISKVCGRGREGRRKLMAAPRRLIKG